MLVFEGKSVSLPPPAEEVSGFYAALLETDHAKDETFNKNFFEDFITVLEKDPPVRVDLYSAVSESDVCLSEMERRSPSLRSVIFVQCLSISRRRRPRRKR